MKSFPIGISVLMALAIPAFSQDSIAPTTFTATLPVGTSTSVSKVVTVGKVTTPVDILFLVDTTGSMDPSINALKSQFSNVVTSINGFTTNTQFGVAEYKDVGDPIVYRLDQALTPTSASVQTALNGLTSGGGGDIPEAGLYALQQSTLAATGFRSGSLRLVIWVGDAPSHDPAGPTNVTQAQAIAALTGASIKVLSISADSDIGLNATGQATAVSSATGGSYLGEFSTSDPNFDNLITNAIETAIQNAVAKYSTVSLGVSPVPAGVTVSISPASITGSFDRSTTRTFNFTVGFTGTFPGTYLFSINALVDGNTVATETDNIGVTALPPTIAKAFNPVKILPGGTSVLTLTITNPNAATIPGVGVVDTLPAGVTIVSAGVNSCGGTLTATAGAGTITLANGSIAANGTCTVNVTVTSNEGVKVNTTGTVTSSFGTGLTATATLSAATPPVLSKSFGEVSIGPLNTVGLTFTLRNPNTTLTLTGLAFSDTLPAGLKVANPSLVNGTCDAGTITATAGGNTISLATATLAAGVSCTFTVNVTADGTALGLLTNTTGTPTSTESLPGLAASAVIFIGDPFQITYAANLSVGDSFVNVTNSGASGAALQSGTTASITGAICANVFAFTPDEQLVSCCSCPVTPNGLVSLSAKNDLASNTLTPAVPTALVIKVLGTLPVSGSCTNSAASVGTATLANGLKGYGTTIHSTSGTGQAGTYGVTETPFLSGTLSAGELSRIGNLCNFILANGSGFGVCRSCRLGGLGSERQ